MTKAADTAAMPAIPADADAVAALISAKKPVPAETEAALVRDGAAKVLARAGKAIAAQSSKAAALRASIAKVEALAGLEGEISSTWITVRALGLPAGAQIGISESNVACPLASTIIAASGLIATTDDEAPVRGVLGALGARGIDTLAGGGRIVTPGQGGLVTVANGTGTLFTLDAGDPALACETIDARAHGSSGKARSGIAPVGYNTVQASELGEFAPTVFVSYRVRRIEIPGAHQHPTDLVESSALSSVLPPMPTYRPHFHTDIISKGALSDVQLETVIYAGDAHAKYLPAHPDDSAKIPPRQGFLVGHGTGVGKGRILASERAAAARLQERAAALAAAQDECLDTSLPQELWD